ncbi:hypothetical protein DL240_13510 [Lujinxingia litoralis]|uniref:DUF3015 domain-containing protein n=1 Tax=Lujinxingia litoralis TaxID=2211119 RepID=A0A328C584_9DELT|nr:DUF3015 family protein [Lujinxingia litoralis]RAL21146.1 hypothetical protein DL240_13510 [Lujinxingia litoralis]
MTPTFPSIRTLLAMLLASTTLLVSTPAWANDTVSTGGPSGGGSYNEGMAIFYGMISSYTGFTTTVAGGITLTVLLVVKSVADVEHYVGENAVALHHDLTMGQGPALRDLAAIFAVPHDEEARFAGLLRQERETLVALMNADTFDRARAQAFTAVVLDAMGNDPVLRASIPQFRS